MMFLVFLVISCKKTSCYHQVKEGRINTSTKHPLTGHLLTSRKKLLTDTCHFIMSTIFCQNKNLVKKNLVAFIFSELFLTVYSNHFELEKIMVS